MIVAPIPSRESARLDALHRCQILDTSPEPAFDDLAHLAAYVCRTPIAVVSLVDSTRQWFKSAVGLPFAECPRSAAFCAHTILGTDLFIVEEADADERFADHPWVAASPFIRFYAGAPLITPDGHAIGSLAVMDVVPRTLTPEQRAAMQTLANQVMAQCEVRGRQSVRSRDEPDLVSDVRPAAPSAARGERKVEDDACRWQQVFDQAEFGLAYGAMSTNTFVTVNHTFARQCGYTVEELIGQPILSIYAPQEHAAMKERFSLIERDGHLTFESVHRRKDGTTFPVLVEVTVIKDTEGRPLSRVAYVKDITERKQAEEALQLAKFTVDHAAEAIYWVGPGAELLDVNESACAMLGYSKDEFLRMTVHDINPDFQAESWPAYWEETRRRGTAFFESRHQAKDGRLIPIEVSVNVLRREGRECHCAFVRDITERKQGEQARAQAMHDLRTILETVPDVIYALDCQGRLSRWNEQLVKVTGYAPEELHLKPALEMVPVEEGQRTAEAIKRAFDTGYAELEGQLLTKDGRTIPYHWTGAPFTDLQGRVIGITGAGRDITARKKLEQLLSGERRILELIGSAAPLPAVLDELCRMIQGLSDGALCSVLLLDDDGIHLRHGAAPSLPESYIRAIDGVAIGPSCGSCGAAAFTGHQVAVEDIASHPFWEEFRHIALPHGLRSCLSSPILTAGGQVLGTFAIYNGPAGGAFDELSVIDRASHLACLAIERKHTEALLRFSEKRFRLVAEATNDILWDWDLVTQDHWWSPNAREKFGYDPNAEPSITAWIGRLHPDDRDRVMALVEHALASEARTAAAEYRFRLADGSYGHFYDRGQIIRDPTGRAVRMVGAMIDVTFTKRAYATLEEAYRRLQGMSRELQAVETNERRRLSRELHDEVGQLLTALKFDLEASRQALSDKTEAEAERAFERTVRALETTDELFVRLRRVVRALRPSVLDELGLKDALEAMVSDVQSRSDLACSVSVEGEAVEDPATPAIEAALYRMAQELVTNVVRHAQAMTLSVALETDASRWMLTVQDDGIGFNPAAESISGVGIQGVRERAEILGGHVEVRSLPGAGTTITVRIPVQARAVFGGGGNGM